MTDTSPQKETTTLPTTTADERKIAYVRVRVRPTEHAALQARANAEHRPLANLVAHYISLIVAGKMKVPE